MLGIGIPQFGPEVSASGDIWAGVDSNQSTRSPCPNVALFRRATASP
jgi:hypothetical protein